MDPHHVLHDERTRFMTWTWNLQQNKGQAKVHKHELLHLAGLYITPQLHSAAYYKIRIDIKTCIIILYIVEPVVELVRGLASLVDWHAA